MIVTVVIIVVAIIITVVVIIFGGILYQKVLLFILFDSIDQVFLQKKVNVTYHSCLLSLIGVGYTRSDPIELGPSSCNHCFV